MRRAKDLTMKKLFKSVLAAIAASLAFAGGPAAFAASGPVALDAIPAQKLSDRAAMQNGAKTFMSYCLGCHAQFDILLRSRASGN